MGTKIRNRAPCAAAALGGAALAAWLAAGADASVVANWTFDARTLSATAGEGTASTVNTASPGWVAGSSRKRGDRALAVRDFTTALTPGVSNGSGVEFTMNTAGWDGLGLSWMQRADRRSSAWGRFEYAADGVSFTTVGLQNDGLFHLTRAGRWTSMSMDLSHVPLTTNNPEFRFRIVLARQPGSNRYTSISGGQFRSSAAWAIDSVSGTGVPMTAVPAPGIAALGAVAGAIGVGGRRRRDRA